MLLTAEQYVEQRYDLPDGGRWSELVQGRVVTLAPPDEVHGNLVLNLTKALAEHAHREQDGYACFELGLLLRCNPDTVRCPAVSYFQQGEPFAEADKLVTMVIPSLVVEIGSSDDRRHNMQDRVDAYLEWGVKQVWQADTQTREFLVSDSENRSRRHAGRELLTGGSLLAGFHSPVAALFAAPDWYA